MCVCACVCLCGYAVLLFPVCVYTGLFHTFMHVLLERDSVRLCKLACVHTCLLVYLCTCMCMGERETVCVCTLPCS